MVNSLKNRNRRVFLYLLLLEMRWKKGKRITLSARYRSILFLKKVRSGIKLHEKSIYSDHCCPH